MATHNGQGPDLDQLEALARAAEPFPWDTGSGHVGPYSLALMLIERVRELRQQRAALANAVLSEWAGDDPYTETLPCDLDEHYPDWRSWATEGGEG